MFNLCSSSQIVTRQKPTACIKWRNRIIYFKDFCGLPKEESKAETPIFLQIKGGEDKNNSN